MRRKAENIRSIFAHEAVSAEEIENELKEVDDAIGDISSVESFVTSSIIALRGTCTPIYARKTNREDGIQSYKQGYRIDLTNLPTHLQSMLPKMVRILPSASNRLPLPGSYMSGEIINLWSSCASLCYH